MRRSTSVANRANFPSPVSASFWRQLCPHEYVFGFFLALTWARLILHAGLFNSSALIFGGYVLLSVGVIWWALRRPTTFRYRVRLLFYPALMGISFYTLPAAVKVLEVPRADRLLSEWDRAMFNIPDWSAHWSGSGLLTDVMMAGYLFFFFYLITGPAYFFFRDLARFRQCFVGLFTVYGLGFIGYTVFPAIGPHGFETFAKPLVAGWLTRAVGPAIDGGSNGIDVFPSIHVAVSMYLLAFDGRYNRRRFWWVLIPCALLWVSTVYLRYHYVVDVFAGMTIAAIGFWVAAEFENAKRRAVPVPWELQPDIRLRLPSLKSLTGTLKSHREQPAEKKPQEPAIAVSVQPAVTEID